MAKKNDDLWWKIPLCIVGGAAVLYYAQVGRGEENNAALIPDRLEYRIDLIVARLNGQFGPDWVNWSLDMLSSFLKTVLPPAVVTLVGVIYQVELTARQRPMTSLQKRQVAANQARFRGL